MVYSLSCTTRIKVKPRDFTLLSECNGSFIQIPGTDPRKRYVIHPALYYNQDVKSQEVVRHSNVLMQIHEVSELHALISLVKARTAANYVDLLRACKFYNIMLEEWLFLEDNVDAEVEDLVPIRGHTLFSDLANLVANYHLGKRCTAHALREIADVHCGALIALDNFKFESYYTIGGPREWAAYRKAKARYDQAVEDKNCQEQWQKENPSGNITDPQENVPGEPIQPETSEEGLNLAKERAKELAPPPPAPCPRAGLALFEGEEIYFFPFAYCPRDYTRIIKTAAQAISQGTLQL
jgi:hypothetical protein